MNEILDHLAKRRSVKPIELTGPGPDAAQLQQILHLAARVPDHGKLAPWRFIVLEGEGRARAGAALAQALRACRPDVTQGQIDYELARFSHAPVVVVVVSCAAAHPKIPVWEQQLSAGAVCMALTIAATGAGFRTCWITDWCSYEPAAKTALGVEAQEAIAGFIHIGTARNEPQDRERPDMARLVRRF